MLDKPTKFLKVIQLKNKQRVINKKYEKEGLTDDVLEKQIEINSIRHELDLPDKDKFFHENFVQ